MGRWEPNARGRLAEAALQLYSEHGYEQTTVAEIARRAGLTERTFFRHYADKREVLFGGSDELRERFVQAVTDAPPSAAPIDVLAAALDAASGLFTERRAHARRRQAVIVANAELLERELIKLSSLSAALADTLRRRGVAEPAASLTAEAGVAVFKVGFERWIADAETREMAQVMRETLDELKAVTAGG
ncbi:TetR/AcrR family transcriptional regulator [Streptomyces minutiscleroticus]|uniref:TetR family transcriptional regulator n=1 Tax=Streptomyces minutiscleroticus TaxID=68238 RepID=A0A918NWW9_9ACTN|nr:TetR/AcrR family transcriptional regulator [Streptomyces minutiscleroticus]GGY00368.1 TetR family transcriptional regulator [Streptomyces minutiscleroticus]